MNWTSTLSTACLAAVVALAGCAGPAHRAPASAVASCEQEAMQAGVPPYGGEVGAMVIDPPATQSPDTALPQRGGRIASNVAETTGIGTRSAGLAAQAQGLVLPQAPNPGYRIYVDRCLEARQESPGAAH